MSKKARGLPPVGPELADPDIHDSISVWDTVERARDMGRRRRAPRGFIARLDIPRGVAVTGRPTFQPGHYSLWGSADVLVRCVVYPLQEI